MSINRNLAIKLTAKQGGSCGLCGRNLSEVNEVHIDHIVPKSIGGGDTEDNLQVVCARCNLRKGSTPPLAWSPAHRAGNMSDYDVKSDPFVQRYCDSGVTHMGPVAPDAFQPTIPVALDAYRATTRVAPTGRGGEAFCWRDESGRGNTF